MLTSLPKYTAYAKVVDDKSGEPLVWKGMIRTAKLSDVPDAGADGARSAIEKNALLYCRRREEIEQEIKGRQEKWRALARVEAPSVRTQETKKPASPPGPDDAREPDAPPPMES